MTPVLSWTKKIEIINNTGTSGKPIAIIVFEFIKIGSRFIVKKLSKYMAKNTTVILPILTVIQTVFNRFRPICLITDPKRSHTVRILARIGRITVNIWVIF